MMIEAQLENGEVDCTAMYSTLVTKVEESRNVDGGDEETLTMVET
jgi:hypothetical protein